MLESSTRASENARKPIGVDLFCGAGGMSLGFEQAGIDVRVAVDLEPIHVKAHHKNFPDCCSFDADLAALSGQELLERAELEGQTIDVLFGGPPCQGFSLGGRRRMDDPRNTLLLEFARFVTELQPTYFVIENVDGLVMGEAKELLDSLLEYLRASGYGVVDPVRVFNAKDFSVPQNRRRIFILGYRMGATVPEYPNPFIEGDHVEYNSPTVWDAIGDLPDIDQFDELINTDVYEGILGQPSLYARVLRGEIRECDDYSSHRMREGGLTGLRRTIHLEYIRQRFAATKPGTREPVSRFYRLAEGGISTTLRAGTDKTGGSHTAPRPIHPTQPRCITVREAARLHSIPDWFSLNSTKWHGFRQVGNSVPPLLAKAIAAKIRIAWQQTNRG